MKKHLFGKSIDRTTEGDSRNESILSLSSKKSEAIWLHRHCNEKASRVTLNNKKTDSSTIPTDRYAPLRQTDRSAPQGLSIDSTKPTEDPIDIQGTSRVSTNRGSSRGKEIPALLRGKIEEIRKQEFLVELKCISRADTLKPTYLHNEEELEAARNYYSILSTSRNQQHHHLLAIVDIPARKTQHSHLEVTVLTGDKRSQGTSAQPLQEPTAVKRTPQGATNRIPRHHKRHTGVHKVNRKE